ncbi:MAG: NfeD family protein [Rhizobium sp.]|nr:NfeD family protein [Rhizobium sp.]
MIVTLIKEAGPWAWWILGIVLLVAEIVVPGNVLVWVGVAGLATGLLSNMFWETGWWVWEVQWLTFAALAVLSLWLGRRWLNRSRNQSEEPTLNNRGASLIGRTADLIDPIHNGRGRIKIGDTIWIVNGPDLPAGSRVRVLSNDGSDLKVEAD